MDTSVDLATGLPDCELPSSFKPKDKDTEETPTATSIECIAARCLVIDPRASNLHVVTRLVE